MADLMQTVRRMRPLTPPSPWRQGNRFELLEDTEQFFGRMLEAIGRAREYVLLEMYLVESGTLADRFIDALTAAAARGVKVAALLDGFGALGLHGADRERLAEGGVDLRFYNVLGWRKRLANFLRDHRKLLIVDGDIAFAGSAGITDDVAGERSRHPWRDLMVQIEGPVIADWLELYRGTWEKSGGAPFALAGPEPARVADGVPGRVTTSAGWQRSELADSVVERILSAKTRAWVTSAYFVPSRRFRKALRRTARRGVDVRLLTPGPLTDHPLVRHAARRFFGKMLYNKVRIFEFQPRVLHAKMILCDDWVSIGSSNLDRWSFKWNLEANQEIEDAGVAGRAAALSERDCERSEELDNRTWLRRGRLNRLWERYAGALDRLFERWRPPPVP